MGISRIVNAIVLASAAYFAIIVLNLAGIPVLKGLVNEAGIWVLLAFTFMELTFIKL